MTYTPLTVDEIRVEEWCAIMHDAYEAAAVGAGWETNPASRKPWADVPEANKATMRAAVGAVMRHADLEWRASHRPGSLAFTGMPPRLGNAEPATRLIDSTSTTDEIRSTLECMGVGERGILVALAAEILAVDAATRYPMRWVAPAPAVLDDEPIPFVPVADEPVGERVRWPLDEGDTGEALRVSISGHGPRIADCQHPDCVAVRSRAARP